MRKIKISALILIFATVLFAQQGTTRPRILAFEEGDNEIAFGFLAGVGQGSGYGLVPFLWERAAFGGMFSFGADARVWWTRHERWWGDGWSWWNNTHWNGHLLETRNILVNNNWSHAERGYWTNGRWNPVFHNINGQVWLVGENGNLVLPDTHMRFTRTGINPNFRFAFHPLGMPALRGKVEAARHISPYVGFRAGFSIFIEDADDPLVKDRIHFKFPEVNWYMMGIRWYFRENVSLWSELSIYDFTIGFSFNL